MLDKIKEKANTTLQKSKEITAASVEKSKEITNASIEKSKEMTDASIKYGKKFIRKKAIDSIREKLEFAQKKDKLEEERIERNRAAYLRERSLIYWTNAHDQGNYRSIHSEEYQSRYKKKKYEYY